MFTRTAPTILAVLALVTSLAQAAPHKKSKSQGSAAAERRLTDLGILVGYPDGTARADSLMTRYEFATAWARLADKLGLKKAQVPSDDLVTDVFEEHWARTSVLTLAETSLLPLLATHCDDPLQWSSRGLLHAEPKAGAPAFLLYRGDTKLLRGHFMEMAFRTFRVGINQGVRTDAADSLGDSPFMRFAVQSGIFTGYPDSQLRLYAPMRRSEFFVAADRATRLWGAVLAAPAPVTISVAAGTPGSLPSPPEQATPPPPPQ